VAAASAWLAAAGPAQGAGFAVVQQGTEAMAQGNAYVAEADNASAIYYNPAGLNQLKRAQFYLGTFINSFDRDFNGPGGQYSETNHRLYRHLSAFLALPINDRVALGLGFFSPFGLGTVWPPAWVGRYLTTFSELRTFNFNPVVSVKVLDNLSLAAGFDALWASVELRRRFPVATMEGESILRGDTNGVGYNLGLLYEVVPGVKLGVSYRSEIPVTFRGDVATNLRHLHVPTVGGTADLTFPASVTGGIAYSRFKPFTFEFDTTWTGWSSYDQLKVDLAAPVLGRRTLVSPKNWHDAWAFRFGGNYEIKPGMKLRAGYIYDLTPVPDSTFDPQVPDANRHVFAVGGDMKVLGRFTLGWAYNFILSEDRDKHNRLLGLPPAYQANGRYSSNVHSLGLSFSFTF
jgi:long-chain fatty acid transport protein